MKKVYFGCSIAGGRDHAHVYEDIVKFIKDTGAELTSELFADKSLTAESGTNPELAPQEVWLRDTNWVKEADGLIMEVTQPSLGVGYEIALAESLNKPILALFYSGSERRLSSMIAGNPNVQIVEYKDALETKPAIKKFINQVQ